MGGVWIREAHMDDAPAIAGIHLDAWQVAYAGLLPAPYLQGLTAQHVARTDYWREQLAVAQGLWVAQVGAEVVGWAAAGPSRDDDAHLLVGEIQGLYLHPRYWRFGIGTPLLRTALARLLRQGFTEATLWVLQGNTRAQGFYRARGFKEQPRVSKVLQVGGAQVSERRYWRSLKTPL